MTNLYFASADFHLGPQHPSARERSGSMSKPSENEKPGVTFRTDQVQADCRGRGYSMNDHNFYHTAKKTVLYNNLLTTNYLITYIYLIEYLNTTHLKR